MDSGIIARIEHIVGARLDSFEAIMFDLDGTLADTMGLQFQAYANALGEWGGTLTQRVFDDVVGGPASETIPQFIAQAGIRGPLPTPLEVHATKKRALDKLLVDASVPSLAAAELVRHCQTTHRLAVVTSGNRHGAEGLLTRLFGTPLPFEVVITGDDVTLGKPDPEPYILAAQRMNLSPSSCLVLEDHPAGIASAKAARMAVVDVTEWSA